MKVKSLLGGTTNKIVRAITDIEIHHGYDTDLIIIKSGIRNICIDTARSVFSKTVKGLKTAQHKLWYNSTGTVERERIIISTGDGTTSSYLATVCGVVDYIYCNHITEFEGFEGYEINHKDFSGNGLVRGFTNNHLYNLEFVPKGLNDIHRHVENRLYKMFGRYFGVSALDEELMNKVKYGEDIEVKQYLMSIADQTEVDEHGTPYIGRAGLELKEYKKKYTSCM